MLSKSIDQLGRETNFTYDAMWNLARIVLPDGSKTTYLYDEYNRLGRIRNVNGDIVRYTYDANGNRIAVEDEEGNKTSLCYDALKRLTEVKCADGTKINYEYNCDGQVTKIWDSTGNYVCMIYNDGEQLVREYNQAGESRDYTYTKLGKVETIKNETGLITQYVYEMGGLLKEVIYPDGNKACYEYDANGNIKEYIDIGGLRKQYVYDSLNQMTDIIDSEGFKKHYCYDSIGNVISETDEKGNKTAYEYSLTGKLIKVTDACGNRTEYQYDLQDELIEVRRYGTSEVEGSNEDANCQITTYERNFMGEVTKITDSMGQSEILSYDKRGRLIKKIDREGYLTRYGYDVKGDLQHIQYEDGREVKLSYDALHQLKEVEDWLGITKIETDARGNVTRITGPEGESITYTYTPSGQRKSMVYPDNAKIEYEYDRFGKITALIQNDKVITYGYNTSGRLCKKNYPNGMETTYSYTARGQIENLVHTDSQGVLDRYTFRYDECGNKISVEKERRGLDAESGFYQYSYDALGRIEQVIKDGTPLRSYTYDAFGNRKSFVEGERLTSYVYNDLNQLISKKDMQGETLYQYDRRGNLCRVLENNKVKDEYTYGAINRLEQMTNFQGQTACYIYNGLGYRVGKELQNGTLSSTDRIRYVLDFTRSYDNLLQKKEENHIQNYFWDMGMAVLSSEEQEKEAYYLLDDLGSPIRLMSYKGGLIDSYEYDEFGRDIYGNQADKQPFGFTGYQYDRISKLYFAQAREYDSSIGRFYAADPYKGIQSNADTLNAYLYCINNPLIYIDPWGFAPAWLEGIWVHMQIERELITNRYGCANATSNVRIPGAGLGPTGLGIADLVVYKRGYVEIYEIKPWTWSTGYLNGLANDQLNRYIDNYPITYKVNAEFGRDCFVESIPYWKDKTRTLTYWSDGDGLIYYFLSPKPEPDPKPVPAPAPVPVPEKKTDFNPVIIGACTLAAIYTIATLAEDLFTGGAGIADDFTIPLVWSWALAL